MRTSRILAVAAVLAAAGASLAYFWPFGKDNGVLVLPGTVETQEVRLASKVAGRISHVVVRDGDLVSAGQPLIYLHLPELEAQRDQVRAKLQSAEAILAKAIAGPRKQERLAAEEAMNAAKARLAKLEAGYRDEEKIQARAELAIWTAELEPARRDLKREQQLGSTASTAQKQEGALAYYNRIQSQIRSAQARVEMLEKGYRPEEIAEAKAELARATAQYELMEAGTRSEEVDEARADVAELEARLRELDAQLAEAVISAPERAVVEFVSVRPGEVVSPGQPLLKALRADDLWVKAFVSEVDLGKVRLNQEVEVTCDAYRDRKFKGVVSFIASTSEFTLPARTWTFIREFMACLPIRPASARMS
jgi:membrane fusion protein YbhG